jgi:hypothetical protein
MRRKALCLAVLLLCAASVSTAANYVVPTTTLATQTANNTSAANSFATQTNGNAGAGNVSKVDVHSLLYPGSATKVYAHLMLWFGQSNHMNVGYSSTDAKQVHLQIVDMISRGIDGVIIDWYGPNNSIDDATKLVMAEAETHPGFTFAIMVDQGAIEWDSCSGCSPQQALINQLQYIEQTYFPSGAYMREQGRPVVTNFNIDLSYKVDWTAVNAALSSQPVFLFQNNDGFGHVLSNGSYSWVMPTTTDYGMSYLTSFYEAGIPLSGDTTVGASYKGFNDSLAAWGAGRIMGQQCGQTWLHTFSEINGLYNSGKQLAALQLVTWNDYEEGTEIESGINNCFTLSASVSGNALQWTVKGDETTIDHYVAYISGDGQNLMPLGSIPVGSKSTNLCSYGMLDGSYVLYVQAVGKPSISNQISGSVKFSANCSGGSGGGATLSFGSNPSTVTIQAGGSGQLTVTATPNSGSFNSPIALSCTGLPKTLGCTFAPASFTPGGKAVNSVLTISDSSSSHHQSRGIFATFILGFGVAGFSLIGTARRKRLLPVFGSIVLALGMIGGCTSCGASGANTVSSSSGSQYTLTINGSSGSTKLSTTVTVTVQ